MSGADISEFESQRASQHGHPSRPGSVEFAAEACSTRRRFVLVVGGGADCFKLRMMCGPFLSMIFAVLSTQRGCFLVVGSQITDATAASCR